MPDRLPEPILTPLACPLAPAYPLTLSECERLASAVEAARRLGVDRFAWAGLDRRSSAVLSSIGVAPRQSEAEHA
jgi:hypothetical protein